MVQMEPHSMTKAPFNCNPKSILDHFDTVDETWVHHFDPEFKLQSMEWPHRRSLPLRKFRVQPWTGKIIASFFKTKEEENCRVVLFHQNNALVRLVSIGAIHDAGFKSMVYPPYSPNIAPNNFYVFPKLNESIWGRKFKSDNAVTEAVLKFFCDQDFIEKKGVSLLEWKKWLQVGGDHVEK